MIVKGLVRPRGNLVDVAMCILDSDNGIETEARSFFIQFGSEGNDLFNNLPDILAHLHKKEIRESEFRVISEFLFDQLQTRERQIEQLVERLCLRFTEDDPSKWPQVKAHTFTAGGL